MFEWLKDLLLWVPRKLWSELLDGLASLIEALPVPDFMTDIVSFASAIPPGVGYFMHVMKIPEGLTIIMAAYVLRFLIRRIPIIG